LSSVGFVAVIAVYLATIGFFAWGLSTPELDRIWTLHHALKIGELEYPSPEDSQILERAMARHADLARALLPEGEIGLLSGQTEGWLSTPTATALRTDRAASFKVLSVEVRTPPEHLPVQVSVRGKGWRRELSTDEHGVFELELPALASPSELMRIDVEGKKLAADPSVIGVRVGFCCSKSGEKLP
jgi:hypothetical protein